MTEREAFVAGEILRIAREDLRLEDRPAPGEALAAKLDSLALLALVVAVEDRFHVVLTDDDAAGTRTLEDLARLVVARAPEERLATVSPPGGPT
ncbi:MAG TPA: phosphopantetheine-binding protein [Anaeromyxobacter sp.]